MTRENDECVCILVRYIELAIDSTPANEQLFKITIKTTLVVMVICLTNV